MNRNRLGCLSPIAIIAAAVTLLVIGGFAFTNGNGLFSPGALNARVGESIGGVTSHAAIGNDCGKCHTAPWDAATLAERCQTCHQEIASQLRDPDSLHSTLLKGSPITCRGCHREHRGVSAPLTDMQPGNFPHEKTGFSLQSHPRHESGIPFTCSDCHGEDVSRFELPTCSTCHEKLDSAFMSAHTKAYGPTCLNCHDGIETLGKNFDHARTGFKLEGEHAELTCLQCHQNVHAAADFKTATAECSSCHLKDDAHKGQFGRDCAACHQSNAWKPATFDHNLSAFKLDGAHANVACNDCHINNVFKGTPKECASCHQNPAFHAGMFVGTACSTCHNTRSWVPGLYKGPHPGIADEGGSGVNHGGEGCRSCHTVNLSTATCTRCHDSNNPRD